MDATNPGVEIIHRGRYKTMSKHERQLLKRRQAVEPAIGHLKADYRMNRCWLAGATGDALHALCCAVGYNLRWLMRAVVRLGLRGLLLCLSWLAYGACLAVKNPTPVRVCQCAGQRCSRVTAAVFWILKSEFCRWYGHLHLYRCQAVEEIEPNDGEPRSHGIGVPE